MTRVLTTAPELRDLGASVRAMVATHSPVSHARARAEGDAAMDPAWWRAWAHEVDLPGLLVDESYDGGGAGLDAAAVVAAELAAGLVPGPVVATMLAGLALSRAGAGDAARRVSAGTPAALVLPGAHDLTLSDPPHSDAGPLRVTGTIPVLDHAEDLALVVAVLRSPGGAQLAVIDAAAIEVTPIAHPLDLTCRTGRITLDRVTAELVDIADDLAEELVVAATVLACAGQVGLMRHALTESVRYLKARTAFGRVVGSFQGVKHQLAELACEVAEAEALLADAVSAATGRDPDAHLAALAAWCRIAPVGTCVVSECLRLHGGIGYTWEHDAHLWFRRARHNQSALGRPDRSRQQLAALLGLA